MKIPNNMTEEEVLEVIKDITKVLSSQYKFDIYDKHDIGQEIFIICLNGLEKYDGVRPLDNFLFVHTVNRLKNLQRDKLFRRINQSLKVNNEDLSDAQDRYDQSFTYEHTPFSTIENIDEIQFILDKLPTNIASDLMRISEGVKISQRRKVAVYNSLKEVLDNEV